MSENYTPQNIFLSPPWPVTTNGDKYNQTNRQAYEKPIYDKIYYLQQYGLTNRTYLQNIGTQMGITITSSSLPTYGTNPFVLVSAMTHNAALVALDSQIRLHNTKIGKINLHVGGNVANESKDNYSSTNFISNSDSHHTAIGKIDSSLKTADTTISSHTSSISSLNTSRSNMITHIGTNVDTIEGITFTSTNFITAHEAIKTIIEKYDRLLDGCRREAYRLKVKAFNTWHASAAGTVGEKVLFFDSVEDGVETGITTASLDSYRVLCSGTAGQVIYFAQTLSESCDQGKFWVSGDSNFDLGNCVIKYNLIGSHNNSDMTQITMSDIENGVLVSSASGAGTSLVLKIEFTGAAQVYEAFASLSHS